jgi:putative N6-adenine-specific DNA methylase
VADDAGIAVKVRIEDDLCTVSLDTSGEPLHRRGHKQFVGKAPLRETMAAAFLWQMGFDGTQTVVDPMCGSGTIPLEAAEIAAGLVPGRDRSFAFEAMVGGVRPRIEPLGAGRGRAVLRLRPGPGGDPGGAGNAERAGWRTLVYSFACQPLSALEPPEGPPGIVLTNPPYGARIGNRKTLFGLYGSLGRVLANGSADGASGSSPAMTGLAKAVGLPLTPSGHVDHSGTKVRLWQGEVPRYPVTGHCHARFTAEPDRSCPRCRPRPPPTAPNACCCWAAPGPPDRARRGRWWRRGMT